MGISRMLTFWRRIKYSSRSSGPSKASRKISSACGGMYRSRGIAVMGSPLTTAKGISTCSGMGSAGGGGAAGGLETTILRSGFITSPPLVTSGGSLRPQMHRATHLIERLARRLTRLLGTFGQQIVHDLGIILVFLAALAHAADLLDDALDQRLFAIQTTDAR